MWIDPSCVTGQQQVDLQHVGQGRRLSGQAHDVAAALTSIYSLLYDISVARR